jgi:D-proline dehydrogenase
VKIIVVGGGIVGLFTAFYLVKEGAEVVIVEQDKPGELSRAAAGILEFTRFAINRINVKSYPGASL